MAPVNSLVSAELQRQPSMSLLQLHKRIEFCVLHSFSLFSLPVLFVYFSLVFFIVYNIPVPPRHLPPCPSLGKMTSQCSLDLQYRLCQPQQSHRLFVVFFLFSFLFVLFLFILFCCQVEPRYLPPCPFLDCSRFKSLMEPPGLLRFHQRVQKDKASRDNLVHHTTFLQHFAPSLQRFQQYEQRMQQHSSLV
jgi:hypothetical protein